MGLNIEYIVLATLLFFLSSCQSKETESVITQPTEKTNTIENLDTLLNRETHVDLAEKKISNLDLLRGYHSIKLGLSIDSIVYGSDWNVDSTYTHIAILYNAGKKLVFLNKKLYCIEIPIPTSYYENKIEVIYMDVLKLKFGEPNFSKFDTTFYQFNFRPGTGDVVLCDLAYYNTLHKDDTVVDYHTIDCRNIALWKSAKTSLTYRSDRIAILIQTSLGKNDKIEDDWSTLKIEDNDFTNNYNILSNSYVSDSISKRIIDAAKIKQDLLKSN